MAYRTITIDLAQVRFIDAGVIGIFARLARLRREVGAIQLRIVNANEFIFELFRICRLDALLSTGEQSRG